MGNNIPKMGQIITLSHGGGGKETNKLIKELFLKYLGNPILERLEDAATLEVKGKLAFTTDGFTVSPIFFPGRDIGKLSVAGTVNDLTAVGAKPLYLSLYSHFGFSRNSNRYM